MIELYFLLVTFITPMPSGATAAGLGPFTSYEECVEFKATNTKTIEAFAARNDLVIDNIVGCYEQNEMVDILENYDS